MKKIIAGIAIVYCAIAGIVLVKANMANMFGLRPYSSCVGSSEHVISNTCYQFTRETALGRNRLSVLMNPDEE